MTGIKTEKQTKKEINRQTDTQRTRKQVRAGSETKVHFRDFRAQTAEDFLCQYPLYLL